MKITRPELNMYYQLRRLACHDYRRRAAASMSKWQKKNPEKTKTMHYRSRYGITPERAKSILSSQSGKCAICDKKINLCIDHDHQSGRVRGVLCGAHNRGLGMFSDDPDMLRVAADYLEAAHFCCS